MKTKYIEFLNETGNEVLIQACNRNNVVEIGLSEKELEDILDELTHLLITKGFDEKGNINPDGEMIEEIIDVFSMSFYKK